MTPYGYRIVEGKAMIDNNAAMTLRTMFNLYLKGYSIAEAMHDAGFPMSSSTASLTLGNTVYTGTNFYPRIIPQDVFDQVQQERKRRNHRPAELDTRKFYPVTVKTRFRLGAISTNQMIGDASPEIMAAVIYAGIESHMPGTTDIDYSAKANEHTEKRIRGLFQTLSAH